MYKVLAKLNKLLLPSFTKRGLDLAKAKRESNWKRKGFFKKAGTVTLRFGPPISPEGHDAQSLMNVVEEWIENEMHKISPHRYTSAETPLVGKGDQ